MTVCDETISFLMFVLIGFIFSIIFDFFRAIRRITKTSNNIIYFQDIIYFIIIGIVLLIAIVNIRRDAFRLYLILGIIIGIVMYVSMIGNKIMKIFVKILKTSKKIKEFLILPLILYMALFSKQLKKIKKYVVGCCKKISYMIKFYHSKVERVVAKCRKMKTKEVRKNYDKSRKANC